MPLNYSIVFNYQVLNEKSNYSSFKKIIILFQKVNQIWNFKHFQEGALVASELKRSINYDVLDMFRYLLFIDLRSYRDINFHTKYSANILTCQHTRNTFRKATALW